MDKQLEKELESYDFETEQYWQQIDKEDSMKDWNKITLEFKNYYADMLRGELGEDIKKVTNGELKVKLPWKIKLRRIIERIF